MIGPNQIIADFYTLALAHPMVNGFGYGPLYDLQSINIQYPYMWIINEDPHTINYSDLNTNYSDVEYNFTIRVGDKVNNQPNVYNAIGQNSNNGLEVINDTFLILLDIINTMNSGYLITNGLELIEDISITPFFNEDNGDVNGHQADIVLRVKIDNHCDNPLIDNI
jgi:hypothetical protein